MSVQETEHIDDGFVLPERRASARVLGWLLFVGGAIGTLASVILTIERIKLLEDADYNLSCSFNPVVTCGQVMESWQGSLFGFPNPVIGVAAFPVVVTVGVAVLAGAKLPQWFWLGLNFGALLGAVFVTWLFTQSVYLIGALCPYCMVVWVVTIPLWWYVTLRNADYLAKSAGTQRVVHFLRKTSLVPPIVWAMIIITMIADRFWYYWETLL